MQPVTVVAAAPERRHLLLDAVGVITTDAQVASDASGARRLVDKLRPDLVVLDSGLPGGGGVATCRAIRARPEGVHGAIVVVSETARAAETVAALAAGADDCLVLPADPAVIRARLDSLVRRAARCREVSPVTGLPGPFAVLVETERRCADPLRELAFTYADLDDFKAYNDRYGHRRGDELLRFTAGVLAAAAERAGSDSLVGHLGGDDFVVLTPAASAREVAADAIARFDAGIESRYEPLDAQRRFVEVVDRLGRVRRHALVSLALGIATTACRPLHSYTEALAIATEMQRYAKRRPGSAYEIDRRRG